MQNPVFYLDAETWGGKPIQVAALSYMFRSVTDSAIVTAFHSHNYLIEQIANYPPLLQAGKVLIVTPDGECFVAIGWSEPVFVIQSAGIERTN